MSVLTFFFVSEMTATETITSLDKQNALSIQCNRKSDRYRVKQQGGYLLNHDPFAQNMAQVGHMCSSVAKTIRYWFIIRVT